MDESMPPLSCSLPVLPAPQALPSSRVYCHVYIWGKGKTGRNSTDQKQMSRTLWVGSTWEKPGPASSCRSQGGRRDFHDTSQECTGLSWWAGLQTHKSGRLGWQEPGLGLCWVRMGHEVTAWRRWRGREEVAVGSRHTEETLQDGGGVRALVLVTGLGLADHC